MSEKEADTVIEVLQGLELKEACEYLEREYHYYGAMSGYRERQVAPIKSTSFISNPLPPVQIRQAAKNKRFKIPNDHAFGFIYTGYKAGCL